MNKDKKYCREPLLPRLAAVVLLLLAACTACEAEGLPWQAERSYAPERKSWARITARTTPELLTLLSTGPVEMSGIAAVDPLRTVIAAMRGAVQPCGGGILSLGEGRSTFIHDLLSGRRHNLRFGDGAREPGDCGGGIHAVDISYPQHDNTGKLTDQRAASAGNKPGLDTYDSNITPWIKEFPLNYHGQSFQNLDLRANNGARLRFPLIISTFALSHVLFWGLGPEEMARTLDRVLDHLEPGGVLIMLPVLCTPDGTITRSMKPYYERLRALNGRGIVAGYNVLGERSCMDPRAPAPGSTLIVVKSSAAPSAAQTGK